MVVFFSMLAEFRGDDADPTTCCLRQIAQRLEAAGTVGIIFEESSS